MSTLSRTFLLASLAVAVCTSAALASDSPSTVTPATVSVADNAQGSLSNEMPTGMSDSYVVPHAAPMAPSKLGGPVAGAPRRVAVEHRASAPRYPVIIGIQY